MQTEVKFQSLFLRRRLQHIVRLVLFGNLRESLCFFIIHNLLPFKWFPFERFVKSSVFSDSLFARPHILTASTSTASTPTATSTSSQSSIDEHPPINNQATQLQVINILDIARPAILVSDDEYNNLPFFMPCVILKVLSARSMIQNDHNTKEIPYHVICDPTLLQDSIPLPLKEFISFKQTRLMRQNPLIMHDHVYPPNEDTLGRAFHGWCHMTWAQPHISHATSSSPEHAFSQLSKVADIRDYLLLPDMSYSSPVDDFSANARQHDEKTSGLGLGVIHRRFCCYCGEYP